MILQTWAAHWGIPQVALDDLRRMLGTGIHHDSDTQSEKPESVVQNEVRVEASQKGKRLWRNNVGVAMDERGNRTIRYGLVNESKRMNEAVKSSDLIGISPVLITPSHVGTTIGQFVARETKRSTWIYKDTKHERAQFKFIEIVLSLGGDACFANKTGTL